MKDIIKYVKIQNPYYAISQERGIVILFPPKKSKTIIVLKYLRLISLLNSVSLCLHKVVLSIIDED